MRITWNPHIPLGNDTVPKTVLNQALATLQRLARQRAREGRPRPRAVVVNHDGRLVIGVEIVE